MFELLREYRKGIINENELLDELDLMLKYNEITENEFIEYIKIFESIR